MATSTRSGTGRLILVILAVAALIVAAIGATRIGKLADNSDRAGTFSFTITSTAPKTIIEVQEGAGAKLTDGVAYPHTITDARFSGHGVYTRTPGTFMVKVVVHDARAGTTISCAVYKNGQLQGAPRPATAGPGASGIPVLWVPCTLHLP